MSTSANNKRIAKNTMMLYIRMLLTMGVSLYTVRVVLDTLGTIDYGLYNVVGGVVTMFAFLSGTMASASQRFFAFELGRNNMGKLTQTFSMTMNIYLIIAVIIVVLAETVGLWFLTHKMTIPPERMDAAQWVFHFSILTFMMTMFTIPYNAAIIVQEKMTVYAYVSILEVVLKLILVFLLVFSPYDKLKLYSVLMFSVTTLVTLIYRTYCKRKFQHYRYSFFWDKALFYKLIGYSGWNLFGALAGMFNNQGVNIILNLFFGPTINAARAIAYQVSAAINRFAQNFMTATRPQIVKHYAGGENKQMLKLVFQSSKLSFFLLFIISMPMLLETNFIIGLWLKKVPEYVTLFTRLVILTALIDSLSLPLMTAAQATGKIRKYQTAVGGTMLLALPVSYFLLLGGFPPETVMYVAIVNSVICLFLRLLILKDLVELPVKKYLMEVILPSLSAALVAYAVPSILSSQIPRSMARVFIVGFTGIITSTLAIYLIALTMNEKRYILETLHKLKTRRNA
ncbi:lipopolysaccharide biosynthesis protein [Mangrovibacterium diazotrophicum]|uniref:Na+-driven multidrug efflux pump n=1 Tax=Mangrovibacterium diazotrophicum TaxID=1261403 RepID=A0A419W951_9BACT|nr:oligosaccharide flippase family protein [Mangrovibacterium diazotrophicum]RKD91995.1 Na+-driven multidrug efflux pump [Mangrovibacterium diazotrophicum]